MTARKVPDSFERLPVLTEVVRAPGAWERVDSPKARPAESADDALESASALPSLPESDPYRMQDAVVAAVEQHIELMLESRLREAIAPALARAADQLTRDLREPLAADLRDVVKRAVAQELARQGRV